MKTKELIRLLQQADPSGEIEVNCGGDINTVEVMPAYYDGALHVLIRDEKESPYDNVIGMREVREGSKIILTTVALDDLCWDADFYSLVLEGSDRFKEEAKKHCDYWYGMTFKRRLEQLLIYVGDRVHKSSVEAFFEEYKKVLMKDDFDSFGTSVNDKIHFYFKDCIDITNSVIRYKEGFFNKNYNI